MFQKGKDSARNKRNGFETLDGSENNFPAFWGKIFGIGAIVVVLLILIFNSTYEIREQEQAVLITFGKAAAVTDPGLHFKIPFIQQVRKVNTTIQGFTFLTC